MSRASRPNRLKPQQEYRALTFFDRLPRAHKTFLVRDDGSEPHLWSGEHAVIDASDREPQHGELYLVQDGNAGDHSSKLRIVQVRRWLVNTTGPGAKPSLHW